MTKLKWVLSSSAAILVGAAAISILPAAGHAQDRAAPTLSAADPNLQGDGTMSAAAAARLNRGALTLPADDALKAAANRAHRARALAPAGAGEADGEAGPSPNAAIVGTLNFPGQNSVTSSPTDSTGAIGPTRYIQLINTNARIVNRTTKAAIANGTLNQLANVAPTVNSFDPQIIWDPTTNKFIYAMDSIFSSSDHKLSVGFSKTASPANLTTDWCHYFINYGPNFPDYPKLGDSQHFIIIGVNTFNPSFIGADILALSKPSAANIVTCPLRTALKFGSKLDLRDTSNFQVFTPNPSQQVDNNSTGYVVVSNGAKPSTKLWFFNVTRNATTGAPVFGNARGATVASYTVPPNATQPTFTQLLDTLDARMTQAVQAVNPNRGTVQSFYTQHTIQGGTTPAVVRWYEINPAPATPVVLRFGNIAQANTFIFNGAISPDRRRPGTAATATFGNSFVVNYNVSSPTIAPRIAARSSFNGGAVGGVVLVRNGVGPFREHTCPNGGQTCRWGDYAAATPDPRSTSSGRGTVWGTSMFSGVVNPQPAAVNGRTQIFALTP